MNKKEYEKLLKRVESLEKTNSSLKKQVKKAKKSKKDEWIEVSSNVVKREDRPIAYALLQKKKKGKAKRVIVGAFCTIAKSDLKDGVKDYYHKTKITRKGKKVTGYFVPMKKGSVVLSKEEMKELTKGL